MKRLYLFAAVLAAGAFSCVAAPTVHCSKNTDCPTDYLCTNSVCTLNANFSIEDAAMLPDTTVPIDTANPGDASPNDAALPDNAASPNDAALPDNAPVDAFINCEHCSQLRPYCDGRTGHCVSCLEDEHCPDQSNPCLKNDAVCNQGTCRYPLVDDATACGEQSLCVSGQCKSCLQCPREALCTQRSFCDTQAAPLVFSQVTKLDGAIGADEFYCGFVQGDDGWKALCSRKTPGTIHDNRLRPHVFTSADGVSWTYQHAMVANPPKYRFGNLSGTYIWKAGSTTYFQHFGDFPVRLNNGTFLDTAKSHFAWFDDNWVPFAPYWHSSDFLTWDGYFGDTGSENLVVTWGHWHAAVGAEAVSLYVQNNGHVVAYAREKPHSNTPAPQQHPYRYHRLTSEDNGNIWSKDADFIFDTDNSVYPDIRGYGRIFGFDDQVFAFNYLRNPHAPDTTNCTPQASWRFAFSKTGLNNSFAADADTRKWIVDTNCNAPLPACAVAEPFFVREGNKIRLFYAKYSVNGTEIVRDGWYTAISEFVIADCLQ